MNTWNAGHERTKANSKTLKPYHAYIFGTSFWYALRGLARLTDPVRVSGWFRPPAQPVLTPSGKPSPTAIPLHLSAKPLTHHAPRPRNLQHLDRRLATDHALAPTPNLQQRPPTPGLAANGGRPARHAALCEVGRAGYYVPSCYYGVWGLDALV